MSSTHVARQLPKLWQIKIGKDIRGQVVTKSSFSELWIPDSTESGIRLEPVYMFNASHLNQTALYVEDKQFKNLKREQLHFPTILLFSRSESLK